MNTIRAVTGESTSTVKLLLDGKFIESKTTE